MNSEYLAACVGVVYLVAAILDVYAGRYGYGLMWFAYASANAGVILSMRGI